MNALNLVFLNKAAVIGILLLLSLVPLGQLIIKDCLGFTATQTQAQLEEKQCSNTPCSGLGLSALAAQEYYDESMQYLLAAFVIGGVGIVFVGLNRRELYQTGDAD